jgi:hypothetical protein
VHAAAQHEECCGAMKRLMRSMNADSTRTERPDYSPTLLKRIVLPLRIEVRHWDKASQKKVRDALVVLSETIPDWRHAAGRRNEVDAVRHQNDPRRSRSSSKSACLGLAA